MEKFTHLTHKANNQLIGEQIQNVTQHSKHKKYI